MTANMARSMISAEFLKLRRRRGIFWWSLVLTSGTMVAAFTTLVILHLNDPGHYGPAGGVKNFTGSMEALIGLGGVASIVLAGSDPVPSATLIAQYGGWVLAGTVLELILAIGLASVLGTRATTIGVLLAWELIGARLLQHFSFLGDVRKALNSTAIDSLKPGGPDLLPMSVAAAIAVVVCWAIDALAAGAFRTRTIDA